MTEKDEKSRLPSAVSLIISFILHLTVFSVLYFNLTDEAIYNDRTIFLDFNEYDKKEEIKKEGKKPAEPLKGLPPRLQPKENIEIEKVTEGENFLIIQDSLDRIFLNDTSEAVIDYYALVDSFLANNRNMIVLKMIIRDRMKNDPVKETDLDLAFKNIRKQLYELFKDNYPVHPKHYNPGNSGGISIPIDKIIDLFK